MPTRRTSGLVLIAGVVMVAGCTKQSADEPVHNSAERLQPALTYIKCKFEGPGVFTGLEMNYYLDHVRKQLLNDNRASIGSTQTWDEDLIQVATPQEGKPAYVTRINRKTGAIYTFPESDKPEAQAFGTCALAELPSQKF